jgi:adenosylhomocysteine nucleosidase
MSKIAIVAALEREVKPLVRDWPVREKEYQGRRFRFFEKANLVLVCGGIGIEAARRATQAVIALYKPEMVYSAGFAGALQPALRVADLVVPRLVLNASDGSRVDTGSGEGALITFGSIASPEQKRSLAQAYDAQAVDMEAAAVAQAAEAGGVQFAAVKAISDEIDSMLPAMETFVSPSGEFRVWQFAAFAIVRPHLWGSVARLARDSSRASRALCDWLENNTAVVREPLTMVGATRTRFTDL